jgi:hypothetical protein
MMTKLRAATAEFIRSAATFSIFIAEPRARN